MIHLHNPPYNVAVEENKKMETDKMSTASSVGAAERRPLLQALVIERRILFACTILVGLCTFIWITAVCTEKWVHIEGGNECTNYLAQPLMENGKPADPAYDVNIANYVRTMISFGIISLFVMAMGCGFSIYTFQNPRYMFKRLAAGIHFISTSCTFVVVQVIMSSVDHMKKSVKFVYPERAYHYYHISFFLAWFVVLVNLFAAASFLWYSRKRKGDKAATDELAMADEPTIIGR
ncbi:hypothetical protein K1T71_007149 [Dendrolimus kikuchii]|uniref:Uncharacterized protein n=1 Tax=Dendrolimus kikuchii TaxID=765133 RepID=A0ACC1D075_9NEOP|nr:hypothetical protein K1T71_007149 [Dendrolimus kikuchii]